MRFVQSIKQAVLILIDNSKPIFDRRSAALDSSKDNSLEIFVTDYFCIDKNRSCFTDIILKLRVLS